MRLIAVLRDSDADSEEALDAAMDDLLEVTCCPHVPTWVYHTTPRLTDRDIVAKVLEYQPFT